MLAQLNRNIVYPLQAWRSGYHWPEYLRMLQRTQYDDPETIARRQFLGVRKLLDHAWRTVPFYRDRWNALGLHPQDIRQPQDLEQLPILTKADIRASGKELLSEVYRGQRVIRKTTSGSTGVPLEIVVNPEAMDWKRACTLRSDEWSGWKQGERVAKVWGNPEYLHQGLRGRFRNRFLDRATHLDTRNVSEQKLREFVTTLQKYPPGLLFGHAHSLYLVACWVKKHAPDSVHPGGIIATAMMLYDWQRKEIEEAFHCKVTNRYGCEEVSLIASECEEHTGLHINADSLYTEIYREEHLGHAENTGSLLLTDITNYAMPLIRYRVGDVVVGATEACPCGRGLPMLSGVEGRVADFVLTPSGSLISGISLTENFALHIQGTAQVQLVQESRHLIRLKLVAEASFDDSSRRQIAELVRNTFGPGMEHTVEIVEKIPQERSGKYRFCISPVAEEYLRSLAG